MEKDVKKIIESWSGVEDVIRDFLKREEKLTISKSNTGILSGHQFDALVTIAFFDVHNVTKIARMIGCSKSAASIMISKMMQKNLVKKTYGHDIGDNRSIYIEITEDGKSVIMDFMRTRLTVVSDIYDMMSSELIREVYLGMDHFCKIYESEDSFLFESTKSILSERDFYDEKNEFILKASQFAGSRIANDKVYVEVSYGLDADLTLQQLAVLKAIHFNGQNTVSKLVKTFGTSASTVSLNVSRLAKAGYVIKEYGKTSDNRETTLCITDKAKEKILIIENKCFDIFMEQYHQLDEEKKVLLEEGIKHFDKAVKIIKSEVETI